VAQPVLVMDIGGGSTELVLGSDGQVRHAISLDVGSVRVRERFLHSDPPTAEEVAAATAHIDALLDASGIDFATVATWVGVGGTVTSLSALAQELPTYDRARVHGSVVTHGELDELGQRLLVMPVAAVAQLPTMVPGRADVICCGALIARRVASHIAPELTVSEADILDGMVLGLVRSTQL